MYIISSWWRGGSRWSWSGSTLKLFLLSDVSLGQQTIYKNERVNIPSSVLESQPIIQGAHYNDSYHSFIDSFLLINMKFTSHAVKKSTKIQHSVIRIIPLKTIYNRNSLS